MANMNNFWQQLPKPFTVLAPMDGVTDVVFRQVVAEVGKPDVFFTEFAMTDGFVSIGKERIMERLLLEPNQKPVIAQIWGTNPDHFYQMSKELPALGFAGIDINMGCPDRTVTKNGACSALIKNPKLAGEIIQAVKEGAGDLPVSVKTRIGFERVKYEEWLGFLLEQKITALTVHLRTVKELSKVPAHWELMPAIKELRDQIAPDTILIGNGDIMTLEEVHEKNELYGIEGFMIGRGIFANPWLFNQAIDIEKVTIEERIALFQHHIDLFLQRWGGTKNFANLKKFAKTYINHFPESSKFREELMLAKSITQLQDTLHNYLLH